MALPWSIQDQSKGARTVEEIKEKSKLGKTSIVIDSLHLFLRIADILINLLISDLRILDEIDKATSLDQAKTTAYQTFLNESCKIRFQWYFEKEAKNKVV